MPDFNVQQVPQIGSIVEWSGLLANIPNGYQVCDGTNGTPDLADKFVRGTTGEAGATGGADSVTLVIAELPSHSHGVTDPGHNHTWNPNIFSGDNSGGGIHPGLSASTNLPYVSNTTGISLGSTGSGSSHENRPAFFELIYIMRLS